MKLWHLWRHNSLHSGRQTLFRAFFIYIICNFVPREYRPIYKRMQPPPPNNSPLPRICDVILHYISVDRHFSVHFYKHFSFLRVYIEGGRSYCMYVPPSSTDAFQCPYRHRQALIYVLLPLYKDRQTLFRAFFIYTRSPSGSSGFAPIFHCPTMAFSFEFGQKRYCSLV